MERRNDDWFISSEPIECKFCASISRGFEELSAKHLLTTSKWEFFFCFKCKSWFKFPLNNHDHSTIPLLVRDMDEVRTLEFLTQSSDMFYPAGDEKRKRNSLQNIAARATNKIYDLILPYFSEN